MTTAADFVREILQAQTDADRDHARLVFADWLEERGDSQMSKPLRDTGRWSDYRRSDGTSVYWESPAGCIAFHGDSTTAAVVWTTG